MKHLVMIVLLARLDQVSIVDVWNAQLFKAQVIVRLSAVFVQSGAVEKSAVTVVFVFVHEPLVKSLVAVKNC